MNKRFLFGAGTFIFLLATAATAAPLFAQEGTSTDTYLLRYQFPAGQETHYQLDISDREKVEVNGKLLDRDQQMMMRFTQKVQETDPDGNGVWRQECTDAAYQGKRLAGLVGKTARVRVSPTGRILESEGLPEVAAEFARIIIKSASAYIPGLDRLPLKIDPAKFSSNQFNPIYQAFFPTLPPGPVRVGDTWPRREEVAALAGRGQTSISYRLEEVKDGVARIVLVAPDNPGRTEGRKLAVSGEVCFDAAVGRLTGLETTLTLVNLEARVDPSKYLDTRGRPVPTYSLKILDKKTTYRLRLLTDD